MKIEYVALIGAPHENEPPCWEAYAPQFPGTASGGETCREAMVNIAHAMEERLEGYVKDYIPYPKQLSQEAFVDVKKRLEKHGQSWEFVVVYVDLHAVEEAVKREQTG